MELFCLLCFVTNVACQCGCRHIRVQLLEGQKTEFVSDVQSVGQKVKVLVFDPLLFTV